MLFYTQLFTSKRGPLSKIWLAAHWERKITKTHVFECNLESTVRDIISPQIKIGLRTSGHLLLGVVRIYSRKTKYLLEDCSDAVVKIKVAFRPGQADLPAGRAESLKAITLVEDFTDFDSLALPDVETIDVVDHFTLNQSRNEEITLKEDYGNAFFTLVDFDESQSYHGGLMDMSFQNLTHGDGFGDENTDFDLDLMADSSEQTGLMDILPNGPQKERTETQATGNQEDSTRSERMEEDCPALNETTLLLNKEEHFALEPVAVTPTAERRRGKRKRKLLVDEVKQLSNQDIREQLDDYADLVVLLDIAPPTRLLMQWKESGGVERLFGGLCSVFIHPQLQQFSSDHVFRGRRGRAEEHLDPEETPERTHGGENLAWLPQTPKSQEYEGSGNSDPIDASALASDEFAGPEAMRCCAVERSPLHLAKDGSPERLLNTDNGASQLETSHLDLPSESSMLVHPSAFEREAPSSVRRTQSLLDSQDGEDARMSSRAQSLLNSLRVCRGSSEHAVFSLRALCEGSDRARAAATFFSLLLLNKQQALLLHQSAPYADITATPGPCFNDA